MDSYDFAKYTSIINKDYSDNDVVNKIINMYYNDSLITITKSGVKKIDDAAELNLIKSSLIEKKSLGNLYEYILSNAPEAETEQYNHLLSNYMFTPKINYKKYASNDDKFFNNIRSAEIEYQNISRNFLPDYASGPFKTIKQKLGYRYSGSLYNLPTSLILFGKTNATIINTKLDNIILSSLNGSLFTLSEDSIKKFFKALANINYYILEEKVSEFKEGIEDELIDSKDALLENISEYGNNFSLSLPLKTVEASQKVVSELMEFLKYYRFNINNIYPGILASDAFKILDEIVSSQYFVLDSVENINLYNLCVICRKFFGINADLGYSVAYNSLKKSSKSFNKYYANIRKEIIASGKFDFIELEIDK